MKPKIIIGLSLVIFVAYFLLKSNFSFGGIEEAVIYGQLKSQNYNISNSDPDATAKAIVKYIKEFPEEQRQGIYDKLKNKITEETKDELKRLLAPPSAYKQNLTQCFPNLKERLA